MTRAEYLRELQSGLEGRVSAEEIGDILNEYTGFFDAGGEEGRTEEETAAALGSPAALARMLTEGREAVQPAPVGTIPGNPAPRSLFSGPPLASAAAGSDFCVSAACSNIGSWFSIGIEIGDSTGSQCFDNRLAGAFGG